MSAFQREARNIIEQDLPHIAHRDNIIRVWKDRSRDVHQILAKATPFLLFRHMPSFQFKYYFQVNICIYGICMRDIRASLLFIFYYITLRIVIVSFCQICLAPVPKIACELYCHILQLSGLCRRSCIP